MVAGRAALPAGQVLNRGAERIAKRHLRRQVQDPELRRKLTPDYSFGCKRPTFSNDYYRTFTRDHVDLETTSIERITPTGIALTDGRERRRRRARPGHRLRHVGRQLPGHPHRRPRGQGPRPVVAATRFQAYQGIAVPGFPNLLNLASPYSYSGLSFFTTIEGQMKHIDRLLAEVRRRGARTFEVTDPANEEFLGWVTERLGDSVFTLGSCATARSYYFNQHGEAALLRPSSTINTHRDAQTLPARRLQLRVS